jgi:transcriptional regulator GlxA family with amidase domain
MQNAPFLRAGQGIPFACVHSAETQKPLLHVHFSLLSDLSVQPSIMQKNNHVSLNPDELKKVEAALIYLQKHFVEPVSGYQLAFEVNLRPEKIQVGFKLLTGLSVHNYLIQYRIDRSKIDLEDFALSIKQVAAKNGFSTASLFIHHFKALTDQTPGHFRDQWLLAGPPSAPSIPSKNFPAFNG